MTLATGATSDGNGGWASVRFNGKSNQQNYLNYDGVDGTYVWDASPGYLNATGSQFRLQTSMESVAEFRVNSGLAPAESGLGAGGNITVVSKSGSNAFRGSVFEYTRNDALDAATKYIGADGNREAKQQLDSTSSAARLAARSRRNKTFFFFSFEGLRQKTGLTLHRSRAERRSASAASWPANRSAAAPARARPARRRSRRCSPASRARTQATSNPLRRPGDADQHAEQDENTLSFRARSPLQRSPVVLRALPLSARAKSTRRIARSPRAACAPKQKPQNFVFNYQSVDRHQHRQRVQGRLQRPADQRQRVQQPGQLRPGRRLALGHVHLVVNRRARHHRHRAQRPADSRHVGARRRPARSSTRVRFRSTTRRPGRAAATR